MANINEKIYIGSVDTPTLSFDQRSIEDIVCNNSVDLIGDELSSDVLEVSVFFDDSDEILRNIAYGTQIFYYSNDYQVGKYYISEIKRKGLKRYLIRASSLIGLIAKENFYGGFYAGESFEDVVNDVLITNGIDLTKYVWYYPLSHGQSQSSSEVRPAKVWSKSASVNAWLYRLHIDFVILGKTTTTNYTSTLAGGSYGTLHKIQLKTNDDQTFTIMLYYNGNYPFVEYTNLKFGFGSRVVVDVDPVAKTYYIGVDYVNPNDSTDTGHMETSGVITRSPGTSVLRMNYAYGGSYNDNPSVYYLNIKWNEFKIYDENGDLMTNAVFLQSVDGTKNYVLNTVNGVVVETSSFSPYGTPMGMIGSFERLYRDAELTNSIVYGDGVSDIKIYGWIDSGTKREALHQLLFSQNVCILKSENGGILFTQLSKETVGNIDDDDLYDDSEEKTMTVAKTISITENTYEQSGDSQVLFDNTNSSLVEGQYIVLFDKSPVYGNLVGDGITILQHNCNAALVTGRGKITGTPYFHSKNIIKYVNGNASDGTDLSIKNIGLITSRNSDSIMNKLKAYYSGSLRKISNGIKYGGEKCGVKYLFKTLYSEINNAFLTKINARSSSFVKAECEFVSGYVPSTGSGYVDYTICTYGESWNIPSSVLEKEYPTIRLNIIGKGHDGTSGTNGANGKASESGTGRRSGGDGGVGGTGGQAGAGGNIYTLTIDVTNVSYITTEADAYNTIVKTYNSSGTLLNTYSSASGNPADNGFLNVFNGFYYARKGKDGLDGASGGKGGTAWRVDFFDLDYEMPTPGNDVDGNTGGTSYIFDLRTRNYGEMYYYSSYGGGGGAAYGVNGGNSVIVSETKQRLLTAGGNGANALVPQNPYTEYGSGGFGGHGGGGGGGAGTYYVWDPYPEGEEFEPGTASSQNVGNGGTGSAGTPGIDGCVIIYY